MPNYVAPAAAAAFEKDTGYTLLDVARLKSGRYQVLARAPGSDAPRVVAIDRSPSGALKKATDILLVEKAQAEAADRAANADLYAARDLVEALSEEIEADEKALAEKKATLKAAAKDLAVLEKATRGKKKSLKKAE